MLYVDTSIFVAALTNESQTGSAQAWLSRQDPDQLLASEWAATEFSSALSLKLRMDQLQSADRARALAAFTVLLGESFRIVSPENSDFRMAARFADQHVLGIRAGDALHLAIASRLGATLCTFDKRLFTAGGQLGVLMLQPD
jgi:uncharacterized protein